MGIITLSSLIFAILSIVLFWGKSIAFNFTIFSIAYTLNLIFILKTNKKIKNPNAYIYILPIIVLSLGYTIFNNNILNVLNIVILPILNIIMAMSLMGEKLDYKETTYQILYLILETLIEINDSLRESFEFIKNKLFKDSKKEKKDRSNIIKGLGITFALVLVILVLLSSADSYFAGMFRVLAGKVLDVASSFSLLSLVCKIIIGFCIFCVLLSFQTYLVKKFEVDQFEKENTNTEKDATTIKMVLTALNIVYLLFVAVQVDVIINFPGTNVNFSNYAREGFFQLMIVSFINIITILIAKSRQKSDSKNLFVKVNSIIMIIFTIILIVFSFLRMNQYVNAFGLTFLRIAVYVILLSELIVIIPTGIYVVKGKLKLEKIYFATFIAVYTIFNIANINNIIAWYNVNKLEDSGKIDINYLENLGEDTSAHLIRALKSDKLSPDEKHDIAITLSNFNHEYEKNYTTLEFNISKRISYNRVNASDYEKYILKNDMSKNKEESSLTESSTSLNTNLDNTNSGNTNPDNTNLNSPTIKNPYTSDSPIVTNIEEIATTYDPTEGNNYSQSECNKFALDYMQTVANTSKEEWAKDWYSKYTVIYESKLVIGVKPNNYWDLVINGQNTAQMVSDTWTQTAYEVILVKYDDTLQMERAYFYVSPMTGEIIAGYEAGD